MNGVLRPGHVRQLGFFVVRFLLEGLLHAQPAILITRLVTTFALTGSKMLI
jgi:hypothetical protein